MSEEIILKVREMITLGKSHRNISRELKISTSSIYTILTGKKYKYAESKSKGIRVRGLSLDQKRIIYNIAKNKDVSMNKLILSYIKSGFNNEPAQYKIYED